MKIKYLLITFCLFAFQLSGCQNKSSKYNLKTINFFEEFYSEYVYGTSLSEQGNGLKVYENYLSILNKYCTSSLVERILESEIDYDPFINAQDVSAVILDYLKVTPVEGDRDSFEVSFRYPVQKESERTRIKLKVVCTKDGVKIDGVGKIQGNYRH